MKEKLLIGVPLSDKVMKFKLTLIPIFYLHNLFKYLSKLLLEKVTQCLCSRIAPILELKQAIQAKLHIDGPISLRFSCKLLDDRKTLESYNIKRGDTVHILFRMLGGFEYYVIKNEFIDPQHNFDFIYLKDNRTIYKHDNEVYHKSYG